MSLNPKQQRFVDEYLIDLNGKQAAIRAGYSPRSAEVQASQLLSQPKVAEAVAAAKADLARRTGITQEKVLLEYARLGFANMEDYIRITADGDPVVDLSKLDRDKAAAIGEVTSEVYLDGRGDGAERIRRTKFKLVDKKAALDSIGRHLGMFTDKIEHSGEVTVVGTRYTDPNS